MGTYIGKWVAGNKHGSFSMTRSGTGKTRTGENEAANEAAEQQRWENGVRTW